MHAAAGGAGGLIVQMAKMLGARVFGTVSTEEKAQIAREHGADETILYTQQDFEAEVKRLTGGRGVDVVYDSVGKTTFDKSLNCLRPRGLHGAVRAIERPGAAFRSEHSQRQRIAVPDAAQPGRTMSLTREELLWRAGDVLSWMESGKLKVRIDRTYPLAEAAACASRPGSAQNRRQTGSHHSLTLMTLQARLTLYYVLLAVLMVSVDLRPSISPTRCRRSSMPRWSGRRRFQQFASDSGHPGAEQGPAAHQIVREALRNPALSDLFKKMHERFERHWRSGRGGSEATTRSWLDSDPDGLLGTKLPGLPRFRTAGHDTASWYQKLRALRSAADRYYQLESCLTCRPR